MDKWDELKNTIRELNEGNRNNPDVEMVTRFLLNLMFLLERKTI